MRVLVSYNRCLYQNGDWRDSHFAELDNGMLMIYSVSPSPQGTLSRIRSKKVHHLEVNVQYEDENGALRSVTLLMNSFNAKEIWVQQLDRAIQAKNTIGEIVFEGVCIKSPTKESTSDTNHQTTQPSTSNVTKKRESFTAQWDALTSYMGAWHRRLFRFSSNGSISYHDVHLVSCSSVTSPSSRIIVENPSSYDDSGKEVFSVTITSSPWDRVIPNSSNEISPSLNQLSRRLSKVLGPFSVPKQEGTPEAPSVFSDVTSSISIGTLDGSHIRDEWVNQIRAYANQYNAMIQSLDKDQTRILRRGWIWKKGKGHFSGWKLRYFILYSNQELHYFENEGSQIPIGIIDLKKKREMRIGLSHDKPQGFDEVIDIVTSSRTWYLSPKAINRGEHGRLMNEWLSSFDEAYNCGNELEQHEISKMASVATNPTKFFEQSSVASSGLETPHNLERIDISSWQRLTGNLPSSLLTEGEMKNQLLNHS